MADLQIGASPFCSAGFQPAPFFFFCRSPVAVQNPASFLFPASEFAPAFFIFLAVVAAAFRGGLAFVRLYFPHLNVPFLSFRPKRRACPERSRTGTSLRSVMCACVGARYIVPSSIAASPILRHRKQMLY